MKPRFEPGMVTRYAAGPTALLRVTLDMPEREEVFGIQCCGTPIYARYTALRPASKADRDEWAAHAHFRAPYLPYHENIIENGTDMDDISIDLETLSTRPNAAIVAIGAVQFNRDNGKIGKKFYTLINIDDAIKHGHVMAGTLAWWITHVEQEAQVEVFGGHGVAGSDIDSSGNEKPSLHAALCRLVSFIKECSPNPRVWGNGATFDITSLESAFASAGAGMALPWHFTRIRDMRTTVDDAGLDLSTVKAVNGPKHIAVVDAEWQANAISAARMKIRAALNSNPVVEDDDEL